MALHQPQARPLALLCQLSLNTVRVTRNNNSVSVLNTVSCSGNQHTLSMKEMLDIQKKVCDELSDYLKSLATQSSPMSTLVSPEAFVKVLVRIIDPTIGTTKQARDLLKISVLSKPDIFQIRARADGSEMVCLRSAANETSSESSSNFGAGEVPETPRIAIQRSVSAEIEATLCGVAIESKANCLFGEAAIQSLFNKAKYSTAHLRSFPPSLVKESHRGDRGYLGVRVFEDECDDFEEIEEMRTHVFLNTNDPFCAIVMGIQGSGKSHTTNVILENCLLPCELPRTMPIVQLSQPMAALVLHYDESDRSICEAIGLSRSAFELSPTAEAVDGSPPCVNRVVVLVSPSYYEQRKRFYAKIDNCTVHPLLFSWPLAADQLKILMRIGDDTSAQQPLYVSVVLNYLRRLQRIDKMPSYQQFLSDTRRMFENSNQSGPLAQRLQLVNSFIKESKENAMLVDQHQSLADLFRKPGMLVIADLTDPMLPREDSTNIFHVLLNQFRQLRLPFGKVVALDEAHKYLEGTNSGLAGAIVTTVRLMRHEGIRILISTQSPLCLPSELFELVSFAVLHCTHSAGWLKYLAPKIPISANDINRVRNLDRGDALLFATATDFPEELYSQDSAKSSTFPIRFRQRLTVDYGSSLLNVHQPATEI